MLQEMPCGKERVVHYENPAQAVEPLVSQLRSKQWFGFAEVDIEVPHDLWESYEEFPPLFVNRSFGLDAVPQQMQEYLTNSKRTFTQDQKMLLGVLSVKKMLLYAPLLEWNLDQGLVVTAVYRTIDYKPRKLFDWFVHKVPTNAGKATPKPTKRCSLKCSNSWATAPTASSSKPWSARPRCCTPQTDTVDEHLRSAARTRSSAEPTSKGR